MPHCVLLGDSILDNGRYTAGGPAVIDQVRGVLGAGWSATLLAVDGSTTADLAGQLVRLPADTTHLVVSVGGNDALLASSVTALPVQTVGDALSQLASLARQFEASYRKVVQAVVELGKPAILCTVYAPPLADRDFQTVAAAGLAHFNDGIIRQAISTGLPLIDLRRVCTLPGDFANEIEPSAAGGAKIASAIERAVTGHDFGSGRTTVYF